MNDEFKDQFETTYTKEDIVAIRKLMFRKKYGKKAIVIAVLAIYAIVIFFRLPGLWNESQKTLFTMYAFVDGMIFTGLIYWINLLSKWNRQKKREISRCGMRRSEIRVFDGWFSVSRYFGEWKAGELYVRPQDIDEIWCNSSYTILVRDNGIICALKNAWLAEHSELGHILIKKFSVPGSSPCPEYGSVPDPASDSSQDPASGNPPDLTQEYTEDLTSYDANTVPTYTTAGKEDRLQEAGRKKSTAIRQIAIIVIVACIGALVGYWWTDEFNEAIRNNPEFVSICTAYGMQIPVLQYKESMTAYTIIFTSIPTGLFLYAPINRYFAQNGICLPLRILIGFFGFPFYTLLGALAVIPFLIYKIIILAHREA